MYFDFEDYHPDIQTVGRALTRLEVILLSIIFHLLMVIGILVAPKYFPALLVPAQVARPLMVQPQDRTQFVFVQPRIERPTPRPPQRAEPSDRDRMAATPFKPPQPSNPLPYNRGNSPERVDTPAQRPEVARGQGPQPEPQQMARNQGQTPPQPDSTSPKLSESRSGLQLPSPRAATPNNGAGGRSAAPGGSLGDALRNLQRYVQNEQFENSGGGGQFGPEIQFDTKGVEFGPWIRRFIAQVKRNWFIPYAAMSMKGHVVITFNIHKDGAISDLSVVGPSAIDAFNNAAFGALSASNPTQPLPPEYPSDKAFFTVTFYYNETPPR